jgi:hypothetical protein
MNNFSKKITNLFRTKNNNKKNVTDYSYDINYDGDIGVETAKQLIIQGIDLNKIVEQCNKNGLDQGQKLIVLEEIENIINIIKKIY